LTILSLTKVSVLGKFLKYILESLHDELLVDHNRLSE
jgi:hypothetical protein